MRKDTYIPKATEIEPKWYHIDAKGKVLGRLASAIAVKLMGKDKPIYTPFMDTGDYVIVTNADKIVLTGKKEEKKVYTYHTEYFGGLKEVSFKKMKEKHPEQILKLAVKRMLPKNKLAKKMLGKLKVYTGESHPHQAQKPIKWEIKLKGE